VKRPFYPAPRREPAWWDDALNQSVSRSPPSNQVDLLVPFERAEKGFIIGDQVAEISMPLEYLQVPSRINVDHTGSGPGPVSGGDDGQGISRPVQRSPRFLLSPDVPPPADAATPGRPLTTSSARNASLTVPSASNPG